MYAIMIMAVVQIILNIVMFMKMSGAKAQAGITKAVAHVCDGDCADEKEMLVKAAVAGGRALGATHDSAVNAAGQVFDSVKPFASARRAHVVVGAPDEEGEAGGAAAKDCGATRKMHKMYVGSSTAAYPAVSFNGTKNMGVNMLSFMPTNTKSKNPSTADPWGGVGRPAIS